MHCPVVALRTANPRHQTSDRIGQVIVRTGGVITAPAPGTGGVALQSDDLADQSLMIEQVNATAVQHRQQTMGVELGLRFVREPIIDAAAFEWFSGELTTEAVTLHGVDAIELEQGGEFLHYE